MRRFDLEGAVQPLAFRLLAGIFSLFFPEIREMREIRERGETRNK